MELFDQHAVSFVSVTQSFNTTTSMGRLTLNVLLSFAQFEREVIGERVRDKISASKRKGIWVGGPIPLGYASVGKKLVVVPEDAETVRTMFRLYLECGSIGALAEELGRRNIMLEGSVPSPADEPAAAGDIASARRRISSRTGSTSARSCTRAKSMPASTNRSWTGRPLTPSRPAWPAMPGNVGCG